MKITKIFCTLSFVFIVANALGQEKYKQDFVNLATIEFPGKPVVNDLPNNLGQIYKVSEKPNYYFMLLFNFKGDNDSGVTDSTTLSNFYEGVVSGAANPEKKKTLIYKKNIIVAGYKGLEFEYKDEANAENVRLIFQRVVFINKYAFMYSFSTQDRSNSESQTQKNTFLDSFKLIDTTAKQY